jgi:hypothetical protein
VEPILRFFAFGNGNIKLDSTAGATLVCLGKLMIFAIF